MRFPEFLTLFLVLSQAEQIQNLSEICDIFNSRFRNVVGEKFCAWGFAPNPTGGAYDAPPDPLIEFTKPNTVCFVTFFHIP